MKQLFFWLILVIIVLCSCKHTEETNFEITGEVKELEGIHVSLKQDGNIVNKVDIKNNRFSLHGMLIKNQFCELYFHSDTYSENGQRTSWGHPIKIFVEKGATYLFLANNKTDVLYNTYELVTTSKLQQQFQAYSAQVKQSYLLKKAHLVDLELKRTQMLKDKRDKKYEEYTDSIRLNEQALKEIPNKISRQFITRNPNNYVSLYLLSVAPDIVRNLGFYKHIYQQLQGEYLNHLYAMKFAKYLQSAQKMKSRLLSIKFDAANAVGVKMNFDDFSKNKLIVIDFWATWCVPCMKDLPSVLKQVDNLNKKNVGLIFVSFDNDQKYWSEVSERFTMPDSFIIDEKNKQYLMDNLNLHTIPRYIVINSKGDVLDYDAPKPGTSEFSHLIKSMLEME